MKNLVLNGLYTGLVVVLIATVLLILFGGGYSAGFLLIIFTLPLLCLFGLLGSLCGWITYASLKISQVIYKKRPLFIFNILNLLLAVSLFICFLLVIYPIKDYGTTGLIFVTLLYSVISNYFIAKKTLREKVTQRFTLPEEKGK
jgi:hypothetical protein